MVVGRDQVQGKKNAEGSQTPPQNIARSACAHTSITIGSTIGRRFVSR